MSYRSTRHFARAALAAGASLSLLGGLVSPAVAADDAPALPSLDFASITPDDPASLLPTSAERFKQADGSYQIGRPTPGGAGAGVVVPGLEDFYNQTIEWGPCEPFNPQKSGEYFEEGVSCGYLIVPLDYSQPNGPTVAIGLLKVPATNPEKRIGTLLVNPGGPGQSGMKTALNFARTRDPQGFLAQHFDYVGFDPRGVASSLPFVQCQSGDASDKQRQDDDFYTAEQKNSILRYNTEQCYQNTGKVFGIDPSTFLANIGTATVARDVDIARSVLGDPKINFLGTSYATSIGYHYAKTFPDNIRAMVLDGIVNPFEVNPQDAAPYAQYVPPASDGLDLESKQLQAVHEALMNYLAKCAADGGISLVDANGNSSDDDKIECATSTSADPAEQLASFQEIIRSAWQNPELVGEDGRRASFYDFVWATVRSVNDPTTWFEFNFALHSAKEGDPSLILSLHDEYRQRRGGRYANSEAAYQAVWCADYGVLGASDDAGALAYKKRLFEVAPFMDPGLGEDGSPRGLRGEYDPCTYYKNTKTLPGGMEFGGNTNALLISVANDAATPYQNGPIAADAMNASLLSVAGDGHGVYSWGVHECVTQTVNHYLEFLAVPTEFTGSSGVETRDLASNVVTGNQCRVDVFRAAEKTTEETPSEKGEEPAPERKPAEQKASPKADGKTVALVNPKAAGTNPKAEGKGSTLAATGSSALSLAGIAALAMLGGAALIRRRG